MGLNTARVNLASDLGRAREIKNRIERKRRELSEKEAIAATSGGERERDFNSSVQRCVKNEESRSFLNRTRDISNNGWTRSDLFSFLMDL